MTEPYAPHPGAGPQYGPPPVQRSNSGLKWVIGCGIGCLVVAILLAVAAGGLAYWGIGQMPQAMDAMYQQMKTAGNIPPEHQPVFDRLVAAGTAEGTSAIGRTMAFTVLSTVTQDGEVTVSELAVVESAAATLEQNPGMTAVEFAEFMEAHPELQGGRAGTGR